MSKPVDDRDAPARGGEVVPFPGSGPSDAQLVEAARGGQRWATEALFRRHVRFVNGLAFRLLPRDAELDDLVQDSFIEAFSGLARLADPGAFKGWLGAIVVRTAHKRIRRRRLLERLGLRRREPIDLEAVVGSSSSAEHALALRRVYAVLESMDPEERIALVLRRVEGLELTEVADRMGLSLATVKRRLTKAEAVLATAQRLDEREHGGGA
jgi:RNA polymerase sigma-70 factor (ECF subfamily)